MTTRLRLLPPGGTLALLLCTGLLLGPQARAQTATDQAAAEALFKEGRRLMGLGRFSEACPKLAASQKLDPGAGTLLNLAGCYEKNGQTASAWATYLEAASSAGRSGRSNWEKQARERAEALAPVLSRITIVVPPLSDVPGLVVERDGVKVDRGEWGTPIPVDPGLHPVSATAPQKQQWSTTVSLGPNGAQASVTIPPLPIEQQAQAAVSAPPVPPTHPTPRQQPAPFQPTPSSFQRTSGYALGAVGLVGLGVGAFFGLKSKSTYDDARSHCSAENRCTPQGVSGVDDARSQATVSTVASLVGVAALAGGVVLVLTSPPKSAEASPEVSLRLGPNVAGGTSVSLGGAW